ncbi:MAG: hypothetical protein WDM77_06450 [Steroidobacteraceae bacterium]
MKIIPFPHRSWQTRATTGLFFQLPRDRQIARILDLSARSRLSSETISTICRMPLSEVTQILEDNEDAGNAAATPRAVRAAIAKRR